MGRPLRVGALFALLCLVCPNRGWSFDRELQLGADLSYALFFDEAASVHGGGFAAHLRYGFTDYLGVATRLSWAGHAAADLDGNAQLRQAFTAAAGLQYAIDTLWIVPHFDVLVGVGVATQDSVVASSFLLDLGGGFEVRLRSGLSLGAAVSYQLFFGQVEVPPRLVVSITVNWRWSFRSPRSTEPAVGAALPSSDRSLESL